MRGNLTFPEVAVLGLELEKCSGWVSAAHRELEILADRIDRGEV